MTNIDLVINRTGLDKIDPASIPWGPTGEAVYTRTYSRVKPNGDRETWPETVGRVVMGNLSLIHGNPETWGGDVWAEATALAQRMVMFEILPAGRHLWASGVKGRQFLFNCHVAGWDTLIEHVEFTLMRLAEGGGVGANYSTEHIRHIGSPSSRVMAHIVCDPSHPDYREMRDAGVLSTTYDPNWPGAFEVEDTREGWADAITDLIRAAFDPATQHEARVFDVSRVRWKGARLKTMGGSASGPEPLARALKAIGGVLTGSHERIVRATAKGRSNDRGRRYLAPETARFDSPMTPLEVMAIDHAIAECIVAGGNRRSARMSIVHWLDDHVFDFINCKADGSAHWSTNISVEIDDAFIAAINGESDAYYCKDGKVVCPIREYAEKVLNAIVTAMLTNGEPGIWNSSYSNEGEPNPVIATNPCGEIALNAWENCNLGHINMDAFVAEDGSVRRHALSDAHRLATRFLIRATYGDVVDSKQADTLARNRRIGVGHFGVQGFLAKRGIRYSEAPGDESFPDLLSTLASTVDKTAREYAHELRIPVPVKTRTMAPTGTIAKMPGRTEGGHPVYARHFNRRVRYSQSDPEQARQVKALKAEGHHVEPCMYAANTDVVTFTTEDQLVAEVKAMGLDPALVESANEIGLEDMLSFQEMYQRYWADNAVSFTVNISAESHQAQAIYDGMRFVPEPTPERVDMVATVLAEYLPNLKGTTLMIDGSRRQAPYERITEDQFRIWEKSGGHVSHDASYDEDCASGACPVR